MPWKEPALPAGDEPLSNTSGNQHFNDVLNARYGRRAVLKGGMQTALVTLFAGTLVGGVAQRQPAAAQSITDSITDSIVGFIPVPVSEADNVVVPPGYRISVIAPWGEPITGTMPQYRLGNSGADQGMQVGTHHDGMHFFPIEGDDPWRGSSTDGLLVMNHEYVEPRYMHESARGQAMDSDDFPTIDDNTRDADEVLKELNGHGVTVVRIRKDPFGNWHTVPDRLNRRVTGLTPMELRGPVRGTDFVRTKFSPDGTMTRGTLNNCSHGVTPWNTYVACEENWAGYFSNRADEDDSQPREHKRYGVSYGTSRYGWELAAGGADEYVRFNATPTADSATGDYRNEPNTFGWCIEFDPFNPERVPQKRTALGRFAHEGIVFHTAVAGQPIVCYSGDDARNEYIYKYISSNPYEPATAGGHLLDEGRLHVAKFNDDGTGEWLPLVFGENGLTSANGFSSQADVLVNTRLAADTVGATKMDRPEWGAIDPNTKQVYFTLTNNTSRDPEDTDNANPRGPNPHGQIIRWREDNNNPAATRFDWDLYVVAGDDTGPDNLTGGRDLNGNPLPYEAMFSSPDGLWIDPDSRIWIQTDMSESVMNTNPEYVMFGNNSMLVGDARTGDIRRFLTGPRGQEITGCIMTPDQRTLFINVQHPGATTEPEAFAAGNIDGTWPDHRNSPTGYGRSATVVIQRIDGGIIGA
ncbi:PhoX family phosphatase [Hoyosella rhizosphaerae]|uniref:PhoX family phosphatase n=1 Tax=Hoyosella rhizosphaerae TaxID=1755582 RepID=A0A916U2M7_9ACTN|nr:PhoX family phosphatase [Hoyosella rhizosphaerae]MBN4926831.1 PhoX family phosphatase [Hoyosella rhizosphaerae]GGC56166.1 hypothetical protein GCM10011410_05740 [Hoyosella rhizosphaerae]